MYTSDTLYLQFKLALKKQLFNTTISTFEHAWANGLSNKTKFYGEFFSSVAKELNLNTAYEQFRCDLTFSDSDNIPLILIECENVHTTASTEIEQLCCLNAPIKALVISCDWFDTEREKWLPIWRTIIKKYNFAFPTTSKFSIIVGEWGRGKPCDDILRYYLITLSSTGDIIDDVEWTLQT